MTHHGGSPDDATANVAANRLDDPARYRYLSAEEVYALFDPDPNWTVADLGSGSGFYTDDVARSVDRLYAVDRDRDVQRFHRTTDPPDNVTIVTADVGALPFETGTIDAALSIRTFHHGVDVALDEVRRVLRPGGRFAVADWSATGAGERERGPSPDHCYDIATAQSLLLDAGFEIRSARERRETFTITARVREW